MFQSPPTRPGSRKGQGDIRKEFIITIGLRRNPGGHGAPFLQGENPGGDRGMLIFPTRN